MASKYLQKFPVPVGFQETLADFTKEVLRDQPENIIEYAALYFESLEKGKKLQFNSTKKYHSELNPKQAEDITKKASNIASKVAEPNHSKAAQSHHSIPNVSEPASRQQIGTEKTVNADEVNKYVNSLPEQIQTPSFQEQEQQEHQHQNQHQQQNQHQHEQSQQEATGEALEQHHEEENLDEQFIEGLREAVKETVEKIFNKFDTNGNGYLDFQELENFARAAIEEMGENITPTENDIAQFIKAADANKDNLLTKEELTNYLTTLISHLMQSMSQAVQPVEEDD